MVDGESRERGERGVVKEILPATQFRVQLDRGREVIAHLAKATERNFVRLRERDVVLVELTAGDPARGRIVKVCERER